MEEQKTTKKHLKLNWHFFHWGRSPERDWKIIFTFMTLLLFCSIVFSTFIFIKIDKGEIFLVEQPNEEQNLTVNLEKLKDTISYYNSKALEFGKIKNSKPQYVDPSL